jgi:hypothetical protein
VIASPVRSSVARDGREQHSSDWSRWIERDPARPGRWTVVFDGHTVNGILTREKAREIIRLLKRCPEAAPVYEVMES